MVISSYSNLFYVSYRSCISWHHLVFLSLFICPITFVFFIISQSGFFCHSPLCYLCTDIHVFQLFHHHLPASSLTHFTRYHSTKAKGSGGEEVLCVPLGKVWFPKTHEGDSSEAGGRGSARNCLSWGQPTPWGTAGWADDQCVEALGCLICDLNDLFFVCLLIFVLSSFYLFICFSIFSLSSSCIIYFISLLSGSLTCCLAFF